MRYNYSIGADPELFLTKKDVPGPQFVSAHDVIPGTKIQPFEVLSGAIQVDGVSAEFNINPAMTVTEFCSNIRDVLGELQSRVTASHPDLTLYATPTAVFDKKYFSKLPKSAKALGCTPDFSVYTDKPNPPPATKEPFRTGSGHIHIGWTLGERPQESAHLYDCRQMVRQLDCVLYPMSLLWDADKRRRELYGKIGAFRPKHYGVEYRCLSNAWIADPDLHVWVFNATKHAAEILDDGIELFDDAVLYGCVNHFLEGKDLNRAGLLELHDHLTSEFQFDPLPSFYHAQEA